MRTLGYVALLGAVSTAGAGAGAGGGWYQAAREAPPRRWEATVYLPLVDNDDHEFPEETWRRAVGLFVDEFGGATLAERQEGWWRDGRGRLRREPVRLLVVSFE